MKLIRQSHLQRSAPASGAETPARPAAPSLFQTRGALHLAAPGGGRAPHDPASRIPHRLRAFTMIEIALCLAIIGFALVAIIGVLPTGLSVQKDNREETIINYEANFLMDAIRNGSQGQDDLTNYVQVITNRAYSYNITGNSTNLQNANPLVNWYTRTNYSYNGTSHQVPFLTNGANIIGVLSTPKYFWIDGA
ncbi:MAG TPA: hypothetical protein VN281_12485, partial [Verrucomicrobiae bacterium]|nr:hypothetical protein [Verrucomicrobiae bacterium]